MVLFLFIQVQEALTHFSTTNGWEDLASNSSRAASLAYWLNAGILFLFR